MSLESCPTRTNVLMVTGGIVAVDYLLAYSTTVVERFALLHEPHSYQITTIVRLVVAAMLCWKTKSVTPTYDFNSFLKLLSSYRLLFAGCGFSITLAVAAVISRNGIALLPVLGLRDLLLLYPVVEELVYRKLFLHSLLTTLPAMPAILINVTVFIVLHIGPYGSGIYGPDLVIWLTIGMLTAVCFVKTSSVIPCILIHSMANALLVAWQLRFGRI